MQKLMTSKHRLKEHKPLADRNQLHLHDFVEATVKKALLEKKNVLTPALVRELNKRVVEFLCETAGEYRTKKVDITNSSHKPPLPTKISALVTECMIFITRNWKTESAIYLAAFALWKLSWIHPFMEGNGRTARAVCQIILCLKYGVWLPLKNLVPEKQLRGKRALYYAALRSADKHFDRVGGIDISMLENYLKTRLFKGVSKSMLSKKNA